VTYYKIKVKMNEEEFNVYKRYNEFFDLKAKLVEINKEDNFTFPPKRLNKMTDEVIQERKKALNAFLKQSAAKNNPKIMEALLKFLKTSSYEQVS